MTALKPTSSRPSVTLTVNGPGQRGPGAARLQPDVHVRDLLQAFGRHVEDTLSRLHARRLGEE
ncbi:hypothetical protein ABZ438_19710 [Streptomyces sp. NPDC005786]|uniref:hypothetical protein n=1 Tax=Streptomyces sp. NPDC005786 TaxID=3154891 RepID=UPI00340ABD29